MVCIFIFTSVNKAKVIKRQSVFDRLGNESPPLKESPKEPEKKTEVKMLKPLKTSVTVQLKVRTITLWVTFGINATFFAFEEWYRMAKQTSLYLLVRLSRILSTQYVSP